MGIAVLQLACVFQPGVEAHHPDTQDDCGSDCRLEHYKNVHFHVNFLFGLNLAHLKLMWLIAPTIHFVRNERHEHPESQSHQEA